MWKHGNVFLCQERKKGYARAMYRKHREAIKARVNGRRERLREEGLCIDCGKDVAISGGRCWDCAEADLARHLVTGG